jgi:hypothetical protein
LATSRIGMATKVGISKGCLSKATIYAVSAGSPLARIGIATTTLSRIRRNSGSSRDKLIRGSGSFARSNMLVSRGASRPPASRCRAQVSCACQTPRGDDPRRPISFPRPLNPMLPCPPIKRRKASYPGAGCPKIARISELQYSNAHAANSGAGRVAIRTDGGVDHHLLFVTHGYGSAVRVALKRHEAARVRP